MRIVCRAVTVLYALACVFTLVLIPASEQQWFGMSRDLLVVLPALFLGLPWSLLAIDFVGGDTTLAVFLTIALFMALNGTLLWLACQGLRRLFRRKPTP